MRKSPFSLVRLGRGAAFGLALGAGVACAPSAPPAAPPTPVSALSAIPAVDISAPPSYRKEFGTMWTFDNPPLEYWKQTYGFVPAAGWLDNVRQASVRLPNCSASFVSSNGLVMTNHHCGRECTAAVSPKDTNYIETGFAAQSSADEKRCPQMTLDQLESIDDVTARVQSAMTGATDSAQNAQRNDIIKTIETECKNANGATAFCQVVTLYNGGRYSLYRFKRYSDVRLVMAPDEAVAFFGGDPDNFTFPRYAMDMTFLRAYENGVPVKPAAYLRWSAAGAAEDELVFVTGNPGSTERLSTIAQLEYNRDIAYPVRLRELSRRLEYNRSLIAQNPAYERLLQNDNFGLENSYKAINGFLGGLKDSTLMARKHAFEAEVRARVAANPELQSQYGQAWARIAVAAEAQRQTLPQLTYYFGGSSEQIFTVARQLLNIIKDPGSPTASRWSQILDRQLIIDTLNQANLQGGAVSQFKAAQQVLPANDPYLALLLQGGTAEAAASRLLANTKVNSLAFRQALLVAGQPAIDTSTDPLIVFMRNADSLETPLRERYDAASAVIKAQSASIGRAMYAVYGTNLPPDATFTLRITDGRVKGYPYNGTIAPFKSTFYGLYGRSADFDNKYPFTLPQRWVDVRDSLNLSTPFNFVSTNDIIGGNSGSPVLNARGEIVGLIFDGNIESHPNRFVFTDEVARAVNVHSQGIIEALRKVYSAGRIADELQGKQ